MSYALRNSILLGFLLCLVMGIGFYWVGIRQVRKVEELRVRQRELKGKLENVSAMLAIYDTTLAQLNHMKSRWQDRKWFIPNLDTPDRTLSYLEELLWLAEGNVQFDFLYKGLRNEKNYSVNTYTLEGEGKFENLYAVVWLLEHSPPFYTVDRLQIDYREPDLETRTEKWDWVQFKMVFRAYFAPNSQFEELPPFLNFESPPKVAGNLFRPLITKTLPANHLGLLEVEGARLKGLTYDLAFLEDGKGKMHLLRKGDRVYMGRLEEININLNRAVFWLNKGGIWESLVLSIEPNKAQN